MPLGVTKECLLAFIKILEQGAVNLSTVTGTFESTARQRALGMPAVDVSSGDFLEPIASGRIYCFTRVATVRCGQFILSKFKMMVCVYWSCMKRFPSACWTVSM